MQAKKTQWHVGCMPKVCHLVLTGQIKYLLEGNCDFKYTSGMPLISCFSDKKIALERCMILNMFQFELTQSVYIYDRKVLKSSLQKTTLQVNNVCSSRYSSKSEGVSDWTAESILQTCAVQCHDFDKVRDIFWNTWEHMTLDMESNFQKEVAS